MLKAPMFILSFDPWSLRAIQTWKNFHLCWFSCSPVEERLRPIQHSRFCWYALSKTYLTFIFAVFSDGFPTEKRNNSRSLIGSSTKWRGRCSRSWTLGRSKSEGGAESGLWKAPYFWEISQLVKNPYQCEKLLISNSLSLSFSLGRHLISLPIIALFFVQLTPSIELARDYGRLIKHCIMAMENRPIIDEFPFEILKLPFMGDFPVDKSCNPCIIHE